jgi:putative transcription factor
MVGAGGPLICEMCGADDPRLKRVAVEGTVLMVCDACSRFGKEMGPPVPLTPGRKAVPAPVAVRLEARRRRMAPKDIYEQAGEEELLPDYPLLIRKAREGRGWKRDELGRRINERVSIIEKLEKGEMRPPDELVKRLERSLEVKLRGKVEPGAAKRSGAARPVTLGDLLRSEE